MNAGVLDLAPESRRSLEFDELLEEVAALARTEIGAGRVRALHPRLDEELVRTELAVVEEVREYRQSVGRLLSGALPDPTPANRLLAVEGTRLDPGVLRDLARLATTGAGLGRALSKANATNYPNLVRLGAGIPDLGAEARPVLDGIEPDGRIADHASPELRGIRSSRSRLSARLRRQLESLLRRPGAEPVIQDDFITQRNGRYVVPVRTDAPRQLRGIVHASSSSGATRFVEPLESVELNNELVRLAEREQVEQDRVLFGWTEAFRRRRSDLDDLVDAIATLDCVEARAVFADRHRAVRPRIGPDQALILDEVRHPLLDLRLSEQGGSCVPLTLRLDPPDRVLVLSGPNTGGKTVALKTFGLSVLMAQSGIPVPATDASLPLYHQVRADIGDHQSIQADLSTYSAHVGAVVEFMRDARAPALFLFDEIGTGTEPTEGAALAEAILEALCAPGMTAVATTHHSALKNWASTAKGAVSAAMEFDRRSLRPTYRIRMGLSGVSAGLEIAERLGLDPRIVARARERLDPDERRAAEVLERLNDLTDEVERARADLRSRQDEVEQSRQLLEQQTREQQELARRELDTALGQFRERATKELRGIRDAAARRRAEKELNAASLRLGREHERHRTTLAPDDPGKDRSGHPVSDPREGMWVYVRSLDREGRVRSVRGEQVEVEFGRVAFRVDRSDLHERSDDGAARPGVGGGTAVFRSESNGSSVELKLLGRTVDEALCELDKFLDDALVGGHQEVRVIHGHGTGRLRKAVRRHLAEHRSVESFRPGGRHEGGDGATIVRLS